MGFIMLTGQPPWEQDHIFNPLQKEELVACLFEDNLPKAATCSRRTISPTNAVAAAHPAWRAASPQVKALVWQLLQMDPEARPSADEVLANDWLAEHVNT